MSLNNIKVETNKLKRSPFNFGHDTFTTLEHGICQPIHVKHVMAGTKSTLSCSQMTRLAPLIHPTFGRITLSQYWQFVSCASLLKQFPHFLAQVERYQSYAAGAQIVSKLPTVSAPYLMYQLSRHGWSQYYTRPQSGGNPDTTADWSLWSTTSSTKDGYIQSWNFLSSSTSTGTNFHPLNDIPHIQDVTHSKYFAPDTCDYSWYHLPLNGASNDHLTCLKLNVLGSRLNSAFIACGMIPTMDSTIKYNALPLFALYKAYFDIMRRPISQYYNWETCSLYKLLRWYDVNGCGLEMTLQNDSQSWMAELHDLWEDFIEDLAKMYYASNCDFISSHMPLDFMSQSNTLSKVDCLDLTSYNGSNSNNRTTYTSRADSNPDGLNPQTSLFMTGQSSTTPRAWFNQLSDEWCRMAYYYVNKRSQIGYNLAAELRLRGYSDFVDDVDSTYIGNNRTLLPISEVISTADTDERSLGDYAGQSSKYSDLPTYHHTASQEGFIIGLVSVNPEIRQCNQASEDALSCDVTEWYTNMTDGFGYTASPRISLGYHDACENVVLDTSNYKSTSDSSVAFGLVPRHFGKKLCSNLKLGSTALFSQRDGYDAFYLDRGLTAHSLGAKVSGYNSTTGAFKNHMGQVGSFSSLYGYGIPDASSSWRFYASNALTNQYNRIFQYGHVPEIPVTDAAQYDEYPVENYMSIFVIKHDAVCSMLPCSMSWETIDCEDDPDHLTTITK